MSGVYSGLQARIKEMNPLAVYIPCAAHSLNLIGSCAAECSPEAASFFLSLQHIQTFFLYFNKSLEYFAIKINSGVSVKRPSETRWSGRQDACYSLNVNWTEIISALQVIQNDESQKVAVKCETTGILRSLQCLETAVMTSFWSAILKRFNSANKLLQSVDIDIGTVIKLYSSLLEYVRENRAMSMYDTYEKAGFEKSKIGTYKTATKRKRSRKLQLEET
jgi:hypothetical protein